jgi:hypothetical protein
VPIPVLRSLPADLVSIRFTSAAVRLSRPALQARGES